MQRIDGEYGWFGSGRFGRFSPHLFTPSLDSLLFDEFDVNTVGHAVWHADGGDGMLIDVLGDSETRVVVVQVRRMEFCDEEIQDFERNLREFSKVFAEHRNKAIFGMMAAAKLSPEQQAKLEKAGIYVVEICDEIFRVVKTRSFKPKDFGLHIQTT